MWSRLALHSQSFSYNTEIPDASHHSTGDIFKNQFNIGMHVCMMSLCVDLNCLGISSLLYFFGIELGFLDLFNVLVRVLLL